MKIWQVLLLASLAAALAVTSALKMGPVRLANNNLYINFTKGASTQNSLLECVHHLEGSEEVEQVSWVLWVDGENVGTYTWGSNLGGIATGRLKDAVRQDRSDGSLEIVRLSYDLNGEYSCGVKLVSGETQEAKWEVIIVDSVSHLSSLHRSIKECFYISSFSTLAMFPKPLVRAGLYSESAGGFYAEVPDSQWQVTPHDNGSFTYSYSDVNFELNAKTPVDISFYVTVGVMKADSNYIPISSALDEHIILHHLGCPEPRLEEYQHIEYHRDTITCRGEHRETEATVTCKEGFHADGDVDAVLMTCNEATMTWVLENGRPAKRKDLECVMDSASPSFASASTALLCAALVFLVKFSLP